VPELWEFDGVQLSFVPTPIATNASALVALAFVVLYGSIQNGYND
jgi:hypothetical protein